MSLQPTQPRRRRRRRPSPGPDRPPARARVHGRSLHHNAALLALGRDRPLPHDRGLGPGPGRLGPGLALDLALGLARGPGRCRVPVRGPDLGPGRCPQSVVAVAVVDADVADRGLGLGPGLGLGRDPAHPRDFLRPRATEVDVPRRGPNGHRGFALVRYTNASDAQSAVDCMNGGQIDGTVVPVEFAKIKENDRQISRARNGRMRGGANAARGRRGYPIHLSVALTIALATPRFRSSPFLLPLPFPVSLPFSLSYSSSSPLILTLAVAVQVTISLAVTVANELLRIGDSVSLYSEDRHGFLFSEK
ncbi:hypothetical protein CAOG_04511 [Capsaspora owczarzaki ATCC 30864]|uniref:hypothetical protein n=1 Tax=Capsaspora owczarzaki (strain ATCC 30864) TaxID=595528 RepID=UPI0001FE2F3B|nr:hypothetical protein CAOG_04511 [Capsaspora owczarzaki ATCC 30864]|eukprot:XP_004347258.1 hypothetical protein CAOG_04511 [Capsaspora owczarzaki ATCC 30864]